MTDLANLALRIDRLESRFQIAELVTSYAVACDEHDMPRLVHLFTEDAYFDSENGLMRARGRLEIANMFVDLFKVRGPGYHWTHDHVVTFVDADRDRATGLVLSHAETSPNGQMSLAAMKYEDVYRRVGGRWYFDERKILFLYYVPAKDYASVLESPLRFTVSGEKRAADYPEQLPAWREFDRIHKGKVD
jgi:ketosteroid isomerase-like protein